MATRRNKTRQQQSRYYEVEDIFAYMVETYINGNISTLQEIYKELDKDGKRNFIYYLFTYTAPNTYQHIILTII